MLQTEAVNFTIFGDAPRRCMPLPSYPFERSTHQFTSFLHEQDVASFSSYDATDDKLLAIVKNLTGHSVLDQHQNFFDIGMDSMHGLELISAIQTQFKIKVTLDDFYTYSSVFKLAPYIDELSALTKPLQERSVKASAIIVPLNDKKSAARILLIPPTNGMLYWYRDLIDTLSRSVLGIQYDNADPSKDYGSIVEFALHYCDTLLRSDVKQQTLLVGWSLGGNIAYDMGLFLAAMNYPIQGVVMIDSYASYQLLEDDAYYQSHYAAHQTQEGSASWQTLWQRSKQLAATYHAKLNNGVPTCLIRAKTLLPEYKVMASSDNLWGQYIVPEKLTVVECRADHMSILRQENAAAVTKVIKMFMDKSKSE